ncbi:flagellar hook-associated protein [Oceanicola granulosus HTCC2516]|uniref:Flagellar hook-associated protein 1 n=1 Tax=Oceanicola granulosus (strain ATCC BAA-861 / DSM 15982 / KCTC 12143 / HTCC2516) TaxID=314256 RepID=Q2CGG6_OCEGH|nr:flagellar hook-associated protein FlgK [Oceanicola granulosus]EAR51752.1 flagellar hook-associated protein [Oceanicola granulosus HTCC2516]
MSLTNALSAGRSGLLAVSRWSETTAGNVANAKTQGYVRRDVGLSTNVVGGGVIVTGITRDSDAALTRLHRDHLAEGATQSTISDRLQAYATALGQPGDPTTLSARLGGLQDAFVALASTPGSGPAQRSVLEAAEGAAAALNGLSRQLDSAVRGVGEQIAGQVERVEGLLSELAAMNARMAGTEQGTAASAELRDRMDGRLDALATSLDFQVRERVDGGLDIFTPDGTVMLDGDDPAPLTFDPNSGLAFDGVDITPGKAVGRGITEGVLAGLTELRSEILPRFRMQLDETARALVQTFADADPTVGAGGAGLFTDAGAGYDPALHEGLAGRITVNDAARPEAGGALWRVRDGMGAVSEGPPGDATVVDGILDRLAQGQVYDPATGLQGGAPLGEFAAQLMADQHAVRARADTALEGLNTATAAVAESRAARQGVDIDAEMQRLLEIEQTYAANSKVLTTVVRMIDDLLAAI